MNAPTNTTSSIVCRLALGGERDPLGPHAEPASVPLDDVRGADEARDELGGRALVDLDGRPELLDPAVVEDGDRSLIVSASSWSWVT